MVCVNFFAGFLRDGGPGSSVATLNTLVDHVLHVAGVVGMDAVGRGPDFVRELVEEKTPMCDRPLVVEGVDAMDCVPGLEGPSGLPLVTAALLDRGVAVEDVRTILGSNALRLMRAQMGVPG